jgi:hypothetical protein
MAEDSPLGGGSGGRAKQRGECGFVMDLLLLAAFQ